MTRSIWAAILFGIGCLAGTFADRVEAQTLLPNVPTEGVYLVCISESAFRDYRTFMDDQAAGPFDADKLESYDNTACLNTDAPLYPIRVVHRAPAWVYQANESGDHDCPTWKSPSGKCDVRLLQRTYVLAAVRDPNSTGRESYVIAEMAGGLDVEGSE